MLYLNVYMLCISTTFQWGYCIFSLRYIDLIALVRPEVTCLGPLVAFQMSLLAASSNISYKWFDWNNCSRSKEVTLSNISLKKRARIRNKSETWLHFFLAEPCCCCFPTPLIISQALQFILFWVGLSHHCLCMKASILPNQQCHV